MNRMNSGLVVAGGTLTWQTMERHPPEKVIFLSQREDLKGIRINGERCFIGATTTMDDIKKSPVMASFFPKIGEWLAKVASTSIRCRATVSGNIVNASPIGDMSILFLALNSTVHLQNGSKKRTVPLKRFFKGYKRIDMEEHELVESISFPLPEKKHLVNYERVCMHLDADIPSVNTAAYIYVNNGLMDQVRFSAGGVGPTPLLLSSTSSYLRGKKINVDTLKKAWRVADGEISPMSDIRGSKEYKRLLLRQLIYAHFITLFPGRIDMEKLYEK